MSSLLKSKKGRTPSLNTLYIIFLSPSLLLAYGLTVCGLVLFRYGEIFKTHILGCPCVMLANPEAARFVLVTQAHLFKPTYPKSKEKMIGPSALFFHQGDYHTRLRKLVQSSLSPEAIRKLIPDIEDIAISAMESWASDQVINTFNEMKKVSRSIFCLLFCHSNSSYFFIFSNMFFKNI